MRPFFFFLIFIISYILHSSSNNYLTKVDFFCRTCNKSFDSIRNFFLKGYFRNLSYKFFTQLCRIKLREDVCYSAIIRYGPIFYDNLEKKIFDKKYICPYLRLCRDENKYITIEKYKEKIFQNYPKKREKEIKRINVWNGKIIKALQVTDIHLDLNYKEGTVVNCGTPLCCHDYPNNTKLNLYNNKKKKEKVKYNLSGKYGAYGSCDSSIELIKSFAKKIKELNIDFIMFTGDNIAHFVWGDEQEDVYKATKKIINIIQEEIGLNIPIYPCLGNHEIVPVDEYISHKHKYFLNNMTEIFKIYLNEEAQKTFRENGYYSLLFNNSNLRIISLNCLPCDSMNFYLFFNHSDAKKMFNWLEETLYLSEKNNEIIYIMDHIPLINAQHTEQCAKRLHILFSRYQNIIKGYFSGHTHREQISLIYDIFNRSKPILINYISSELSSYGNLNPSFRYYEIDYESKFIKDFIQYRFDLEKSNFYKKDFWYISYKGSELFNVSDLSDLEGINKYEINYDFLVKKYTDSKYYDKLNTNKDYLLRRAKCFFRNDIQSEFNKCIKVGISIENEYVYPIFNKVMGLWREDE